MSSADLRLRLTKPDLMRSYLLLLSNLIPSLSYLLLLVRQISSFLVTSNGEIYTDVLAPDARRRDVSTMLNPDFGDYALRHFYGSRFHFYLFFRHMNVPHCRSQKDSLRKSQLLNKTLTYFRF